ncbi:MAG: RHS repeat-associated core domain-containing protein [Flavobacterium sp.]
MRRVTTNGTVIATTDYLDGFQYLKPKTSAALALQFFPTAEGYVNNTVSGGVNNYNYIYTYKDHLGNVRIVYTKDPASGITKILEESNYYPYGLQHANYNWSKQYYDEFISGQIEIELVPALPYKYKYNGKEWQDELGLGVYDYGARNYEPAIGRWMNIDPLAEMSRRYMPYAYALDNPVYFIDPDGRRTFPHWEGDYNWKTGRYRSGSFDAAMANAGVSSDNASTSSFDDVKISDGMEEDAFLMMYGANEIGRDEVPVNLFDPKKDSFNGVANSRSYEVGDGRFTLFAHGAKGFIMDQKNGLPIRNAKDFDVSMEMENSNWKDTKDKKGTILAIWSCESASISENGLSLAQMVSIKHPNIIVFGADGFVNYGRTKDGYLLTGIDTIMDSGKNDGFVVGYQNGIEVYRKGF